MGWGIMCLGARTKILEIYLFCFMCMSVLPVVCLCTMCVAGACKGQKRALDLLELDSVSHHVDKSSARAVSALSC